MQQDNTPSLDDAAFLDFLVSEGLIAKTEAQRAIAASSEANAALEHTLMEFGMVAEDPLYRAIAMYLDLPFIPSDGIDVKRMQDFQLPHEFLARVEIVPVREGPEGVLLALANPRAKDVLDGIAFHLDANVLPAIAAPGTIKAALQKSAPGGGEETGNVSSADIERLTALANDGPVIKLVNDLIAQAIDLEASDVHIEAGEAEAKVRFRIDGLLVPHGALPEAVFSAVASRLKVMAQLNISEKRRPQDGRAYLSVRGRSIDIRMSTLPTQYGESIVLRLLDKSRVALDWQSLGYTKEDVTRIKSTVTMPNGVFLVAGPTGSGKTTTLYTAMGSLNSTDRKIVTVEDPIEYTLPGVNQVQVDTDIDMSFAKALRSILRQDPDVVMVGEIRDEETAEIAIRAALVGRMVLSTIHTNDSLSAITRLRDLGVPPYLLAATLRGVLSQRLVRTICSACAGKGCGGCNSSGQRGRTVLSEFLTVSPELAECISKDGARTDLAKAAADSGFITMGEKAEVLVQSGLVASSETHRIVGT